MTSASPCLRGVIFDMDGVVIDSEPLSLSTIAEIIGEHGGRVDHRELASLAGAHVTEVLRVAAEHSGPALNTATLHRAYQERYLARLRADARPTPGLTTLLVGLRTARVPIGLASSSSVAEINEVVRALRLGPVLRAVASADEVAKPKPAPDVYHLAIERLGTGHGGIVAIEDSATGVASACAAGLPCVAVRTTTTCWQDLSPASLLVDSLAALDVGVLRRLVSDRA